MKDGIQSDWQDLIHCKNSLVNPLLWLLGLTAVRWTYWNLPSILYHVYNIYERKGLLKMRKYENDNIKEHKVFSEMAVVSLWNKAEIFLFV